MIKFAIPSSRVHEWNDIKGGTNIPAQPRVVGADAVLVGGAATSADANKYYIAVGATGAPLKFKNRKNIFQASSPSVAAQKFFNSWWKSSGQGACSSGSSFDEAFKNIQREQLEKELLVRVVEVGGRSVRNYIVKYVPNMKPNRLERETKIVCTSKATLLTSLSVRAPNIYELESFSSL